METFVEVIDHCIKVLKCREIDALPNIILKRLLSAYVRDCVETNYIDPMTADNITYRELEKCYCRYSDWIQFILNWEFEWEYEKNEHYLDSSKITNRFINNSSNSMENSL